MPDRPRPRRRVGLGADEQEAVYFGSLVAWVGCHVDAYEQAKWFGDETVLKGDFRQPTSHSATSGPLFMMRHLGGGLAAGTSGWRLVPAFIGEGGVRPNRCSRTTGGRPTT